MSPVDGLEFWRALSDLALGLGMGLVIGWLVFRGVVVAARWLGWGK